MVQAMIQTMIQTMIKVEVIYAEAEQQCLQSLTVEQHCNVADAIQQSGLLQKFPQIDLAVNKVGIFSRLVTLDTIVQEGDRIEIYRSLLVDPKQARRLRAQKQKVNK